MPTRPFARRYPSSCSVSGWRPPSESRSGGLTDVAGFSARSRSQRMVLRLWVWTCAPWAMGCVVLPMGRAYLSSTCPAGSARMAILCPSGTASVTLSVVTKSPSRVTTPTSSPGARSITATPASSWMECMRTPCVMGYSLYADWVIFWPWAHCSRLATRSPFPAVIRRASDPKSPGSAPGRGACRGDRRPLRRRRNPR